MLTKTSSESYGPLPGWYAISVMILRGCLWTVNDGHGGSISLDLPYYTYFLRFRPVAMAGYSIFIYHITLEDANRVRREMGLPLLTEKPSSEDAS